MESTFKSHVPVSEFPVMYIEQSSLMIVMFINKSPNGLLHGVVVKSSVNEGLRIGDYKEDWGVADDLINNWVKLEQGDSVTLIQ